MLTKKFIKASQKDGIRYAIKRALLVFSVEKETLFQRDKKKESFSKSLPFLKRDERCLKVSIIVPNYNHESFLRQRLDSIYNQSYQNFDVILLDDCSTDGSLDILVEYKNRFPQNTQLFVNETNSGRVFDQWKKGLSASIGDLVWIAESDDYCDANFLQLLTSSFQDESILLAYSNTEFIDKDGKNGWSLQDYLHELSPDKWNKSYINSGENEVKNYFSRKNIIPNVSSAVFRKERAADALKDISILTLKVCGDWVFYLNLIRGGAVRFVREANNYYRQHTSNTSASSYKYKEFYKEYQIVEERLVDLYFLNEEEIKLFRKFTFDQWRRNSLDLSNDEFFKIFNSNLGFSHNKKNKIAICSAGFGGGGGEIFPIRLANALYQRGHAVTFVNFDLVKLVSVVRELLNPAIAVVNISSIREFDRILNSYDFDVIHSHHVWVDIMISSINQDKKWNHVVTMHGMYESVVSKEHEDKLNQVLNSVGKWVYLTDRNLSLFKSKGLLAKMKTFKIGNGIEVLPPLQIDRASLSLDDNAFYVCLVSRAIKEKGWLEAREIIKRVRELTGGDVRLLLVGDGPLYDEYAAKETEDYISWVGFSAKPQEYFAVSDLAILPTYYSGESFPLVVMEALQQCIPVVATDLGEIRSMLTCADGQFAGNVFPLEYGGVPIEKMSQALAIYFGDQSFYDQRVLAADIVKGKFDINTVVESYERIYSS